MAFGGFLSPGVLAEDRVEKVASRGTTVDGAYLSAPPFAAGKLFAPIKPVRATIVHDDKDLIFSLRGSAKGNEDETVEIYFDGKKPVNLNLIKELTTLDKKTGEFLKLVLEDS